MGYPQHTNDENCEACAELERVSKHIEDNSALISQVNTAATKAANATMDRLVFYSSLNKLQKAMGNAPMEAVQKTVKAVLAEIVATLEVEKIRRALPPMEHKASFADWDAAFHLKYNKDEKGN